MTLLGVSTLALETGSQTQWERTWPSAICSYMVHPCVSCTPVQSGAESGAGDQDRSLECQVSPVKTPSMDVKWHMVHFSNHQVDENPTQPANEGSCAHAPSVDVDGSIPNGLVTTEGPATPIDLFELCVNSASCSPHHAAVIHLDTEVRLAAATNRLR